MAQIKNIENLSAKELEWEINNGAKFVVFEYCISIVVMTFRRGSSIYFIRAGESAAKHSVWFTILTFILGWWGIPWGPIYSITSLVTNFSGGKDVTPNVLAVLQQRIERTEVLHD